MGVIGDVEKGWGIDGIERDWGYKCCKGWGGVRWCREGMGV